MWLKELAELKVAYLESINTKLGENLDTCSKKSKKK
jgi:hypothetical protein